MVEKLQDFIIYVKGVSVYECLACAKRFSLLFVVVKT